MGIKEQNLAQKSSLTTSDFIRVVGSDNVSYKQNMTDVGKTLSRINNTTAIPANSDLNDYTTVGVYGVSATNTAQTIANSPVTVAFLLEVLYLQPATSGNWLGAIQRITDLNGQNVYMRRLFTNGSGQWNYGTWVKQPTRTEVDALSNKSNPYAKVSLSNVTLDGAYGFLTSASTELWIYVPLLIENDVTLTASNVTSLKLGLRTSSGGYVGGQDNYEVVSLLTQAGVLRRQGLILFRVKKDAGWGLTNNTVFVGRITLTATLS